MAATNTTSPDTSRFTPEQLQQNGITLAQGLLLHEKYRTWKWFTKSLLKEFLQNPVKYVRSYLSGKDKAGNNNNEHDKEAREIARYALAEIKRFQGILQTHHAMNQAGAVLNTVRAMHLAIFVIGNILLVGTLAFVVMLALSGPQTTEPYVKTITLKNEDKDLSVPASLKNKVTYDGTKTLTITVALNKVEQKLLLDKVTDEDNKKIVNKELQKHNPSFVGTISTFKDGDGLYAVLGTTGGLGVVINILYFVWVGPAVRIRKALSDTAQLEMAYKTYNIVVNNIEKLGDELGLTTYAKFEGTPPSPESLGSLNSKIDYNLNEKLLSFKGVMSTEERDTLNALSEEKPYKNAIEELYLKSQLNKGKMAYLGDFTKEMVTLIQDTAEPQELKPEDWVSYLEKLKALKDS